MPLAAALPPAAPFLYLRREPPPHPLNPPAKGRQNLLNPLNLLNPHVRILHRMRKSAEVGPA